MITPVDSAKNPSFPTEESKFRLLVRVNYSFTVLSHSSMETGVGVASFSPISIGYNREPRDVALFNKLFVLDLLDKLIGNYWIQFVLMLQSTG